MLFRYRICQIGYLKDCVLQCGEEGHMSRDCPTGGGSSGGGTIIYYLALERVIGQCSSKWGSRDVLKTILY